MIIELKIPLKDISVHHDNFGVHIETQVCRISYPKCTCKTRLVKFRGFPGSSPKTWLRNKQSIPSNLIVTDPNYSLNIKLWNAAQLLYQLIQIPSTFRQHLRLFINRLWPTRSGCPKRVFGTDAFKIENRGCEVCPKINDVTAPCEPIYVIVTVIVGFQNLTINGVP